MIRERHGFLEIVIIIAVILFGIYALDNSLWTQLAGIGQQVVYLIQLSLTKLTAYLSSLQ